MKTRCEWCGCDPLYVAYHDEEWGIPVHDDRHLFEMLILEGAQAGLSWLTVLRKRENYRKAFDAFSCEKIAAYTQADIDRLLVNPGIIRNRLKVDATIKNAQGTLAIQDKFGSLDAFLWRFVNGVPIQNNWKSLSDLPPTSAASDAMSKELKKLGFNFVGSTICYSLMQAVGMVNDHVISCYRHAQLAREMHVTQGDAR